MKAITITRKLLHVFLTPERKENWVYREKKKRGKNKKLYTAMYPATLDSQQVN
jgi:hypothetical protein